MITKAITNAFDFGEVATQLVPLHSRGPDHQWMQKHAASHPRVFQEVIKQLRPQKGRTIIHVIALGDEEIYGPNRNCDGFSARDNRTAHRSFKDIGHVFKHHKNDDPFKAVGDVIATAHNEQTSRVQLLLGLDNNKCRREVDALDRGEDIPVSMGSMQDFDVCSICGHKAPTAADHCHHITDMLGQLMDDGRKVYMQNPNPKYFDISLVFKPADRIAYTLKKVAAAGSGVVGGHDLADIYGLRSFGDPKYATLRALASMYKEIPASLRKVTTPGKLKTATVKELRKHAQLEGMEHLLAFLSANGWLLSPEDMGEVIGHPNPEGCGQAVEDHPVLDELLDDHTEIRALQAPDFCNQISLSDFARADLDSQASMLPGPLDARILRVSIVKPVKIASSPMVDDCDARGFASLYGHYKVAFANRHRTDRAVVRAVAATF